MTTIVIVESPNKINILSNILGKNYKVIASCGHVMDLCKKKLAIDVENNFNPMYEPLENKKKIITKLKSDALKSNIKEIILCGDIDFEGTFINWSLKTVLKLNNPRTLEFIALTKEEVLKGLNNKTYINNNHLEAQQTRRFIDRLCGFLISPILIQIFGSNTSAGRVQSVVTKLIVDKEKEIQEYIKLNKGSLYNLTGDFKIDDNDIILFEKCKYIENVEKQNITNLLEILKKSNYTLFYFKENIIINKPSKPFNTASIQQVSNSNFGYSTKTTMNTLQSLFTKGYITYHRTTSIQLSKECIDMCKEYILNIFNDKYYNQINYKDKKLNSENSHEAIRYTDNKNTPKELKNVLSLEELKLYTLIFNTTVMSQMSNQIINEIELHIVIDDMLDDSKFFTTKIKHQEFDGFTVLKNNKDIFVSKDKYISMKLLNNKNLKMIKIDAVEKYQNAPQRYNEATLVNKLSPKNLNIGRPSTYSSIITKIQDREYVTISNIEGIKKNVVNYIIENNIINKINNYVLVGKENNKFIPTELGIKITDFMELYFTNIINYKFTAELEERMDLIANNKFSKIDCLTEFYNILKNDLDKIHTKQIKSLNSKLLGIHPETNQEIYILNSKYGYYIKMKNINKDFNKKFLTVSLKNNNLNPDKITLNEACELFKYPKVIGIYNGFNILLNNGKYSYYLMYNNINITIPNNNIENFDEYCNNLNLNDAITIISTKINNCLLELSDKTYKYKIMNGTFGKYIQITSIKTKKSKNIKLPIKYENTYSNLSIEEIKLIKPSKRIYKKK